MTQDLTQDRFQKIGVPQGDTDDTLSSTPIGTKGAPVAPPFPAGASGDQPPPAAERLDHYVIAGGVPAPGA